MSEEKPRIHTTDSLQADDSAPDTVKFLGMLLSESAWALKDHLPPNAEVTVVMRFPEMPGSVMMASTETEGFNDVLEELLHVYSQINGGKQ